MNGAEVYWKMVQRKDDYEAVFGTPAGKRVLRDHLRACCVFGRTHVPGDPASSAFNNGMREGALLLVKALNLTEEELMQMAKERAE